MKNNFLKKIRQNSDLKPALISEQISRILTESIIEGNLNGGDRLIEVELQNALGVSRAPIREAFRNLEAKGLIHIVPRKGAFVKTITRKDIDEFFPILAMLEGLAARLAADRLTDSDFAEMREALKKMELDSKRNDAKSFRDHHNEFHQIFVRASGSSLLQNLVQNLRMHVMWYRFTLQYHKENPKKSLKIHKNIVELFRKRLGKDVETIVREHIEAGHKKFIGYLNNNFDKNES